MESNSADCDKQQNTIDMENRAKEVAFSVSQRRVSDLRQFCEQLTEEKEKLLSEVTTLREKLSKFRVRQQKCEEDNETALEIIFQLESELYAWKNDYFQEVLLVETHEKSLKELYDKEEAWQGETKKMIDQIQQTEKDQQRMKQQLQKLKTLNKTLTKDMNQLKLRNAKQQEENEEKLLTLENIYLDLRQRDTELKFKEKELTNLKKEEALNKKMMEDTQKKVMCLEQQKMALEQANKLLKNQISSLIRERDMMRKQWDKDMRVSNKMLYDREILHKRLTKVTSTTETQMYLGNLDRFTELLKYKDEVEKQQKVISKLRTQNENNLSEISKLKDKANLHLEENKLLEMKVFKYKKTIAETENKLKTKQKKYMILVSDFKKCRQKLLTADNP